MNQKEFAKHLNTFVTNIYIYTNDTGAKKFLQVFGKLNMSKVIKRYYDMMSKYQQDLTKKNNAIFNTPLFILPEIDMSLLWPRLNTEQKDIIWNQMKLLFDISNKIVSNIETLENSSSSDSDKKAFNPYVGIGVTNNECTINTLSSGPTVIPGNDNNQNNGIMTQVTKMLNVDELKKHLSDIDPNNVDDAINNLEGSFKNCVDEKTGDIIHSMLGQIGDKLKTGEIVQGNILQNIMGLIDNVSKDITPRMESEGVNIKNIWESTQNIAMKCEDGKGNKILGNNPMMQYLNTIMAQQINNIPEQNQNPVSEEEYIKKCNDMLKNVGLGNIDIRDMDLGNKKNKKK